MIKTFFRRLSRFATIVKNILVSLLVVLIVVEIVAVLMIARPSLPDQGILLLDLRGELVEQIREPGDGGLLPSLPDPDQVRVRDVSKVLQAAAADPRILAVRLDLEELQQASLSKIHDLHQAIETFKANSGKPVWVAQYNYTQAQYLLATAADEIWLHNMGNVMLSGIGVYRNYIREALDKLDVDVHVFRVGKYKSALEPLIRNSMSEEDKQANQLWMDSLWQLALQTIETSRRIPAAHTQDLLDHPDQFLRQYHGDTAALLLAEKFIDRIADPEDMQQAFDEKFDASLEDIPYKDYLRSLPTPAEEGQQHIAIITASGTITAGEQPPGVVGGTTIAHLLERAADDEATKAVVLRVDSPGGSAQASEVIRHAVEKMQQAGKPVVVSMGSLAASGGYWISAGADEIWAQESTLTGSIGVFGALPNISRGLQRMGIYSDGLGTTRSAEGIRLDRPLPAPLQAVVQMNVEHIYQQFINIVAKGRDIPSAQVNEIAQGRVWSGKDALRIGLVDYLGDLDQAIDAAARLAHIEDDFQSYDLTAPKAWPAILMQSIMGEASILPPSWRSWMNSSQALQSKLEPWTLLLKEPSYVYAYSGLQP